MWGEIAKIPKGRTASYSEIAVKLNRPGSARAVGSAVGANTIEGVVPCYRVVPKSGEVGSYRWGSARKRELLCAEKPRTREPKVVALGDVLSIIKSGDSVVVSQAAALPVAVLREMVAHKERFRDVKIFHVLPLGYTDYLSPGCAGHFRHVTTFCGTGSREAVERGDADFIPCFFKDVPALMGREVAVDVAVVSVAPPDEDGWCSLGLSCDYMPAALSRARVVVALVNRRMPVVGGRVNGVHLSNVDYVVECDEPLPVLVQPAVTDVELAVARNVAGLIDDGDTLQLGIGAIPDSVLGFLGDRRHLGLHSEIFSDGAMELIRKGVIDGSRKTLHRGKAVATFLIGSDEFYSFVDGNPVVEMLPVDYVNDPRVIGMNDNMVSVNSCIEVDLTGQVNSEAIGSRQFSGIGGQVDFVRGARLSRGGRSIIAMPSVTKNGVSRVVSSLSTVTTSRGDVDCVVTEYGVAHLRGKSLASRREALINIAHPDYRDRL